LAYLRSHVCHDIFAQMAVFGSKIGKGVLRCRGNETTSLLLLEVVIFVQTHAVTETNWIYNLSHAICYSYGADNNKKNSNNNTNNN